MFKLIRRIIFAVVAICAIFVIYTIAANMYIVNSTRGDVHTIEQIQSEQIHVDAIVVLGASVFADGTPSDILADRLEVACDLYKEGVAPKIIVSGDNRTAHYNESDAMAAYCEELGVPSSSIDVDHEGYDTYASIYRAYYEFDAKSMIVVTQAYHLYRALAIGKVLGATSYGVAADKGSYDNQFMYSIREILARDKDLIMAAMQIQP